MSYYYKDIVGEKHINKNGQKEILKDEEVRKRILKQSAASSGLRVGAYLIDAIINSICYLPIILLTQSIVLKNLHTANDVFYVWYKFFTGQHRIFVYLYIALLPLIFQLMIPMLTNGRTIGKALLGLKIILDDGNDAMKGQLFFRSIIYTVIPRFDLIPFIGIVMGIVLSILWIISGISLFSDEYQRSLHDRWSDSIVVNYRTYENLLMSERMKETPPIISDDEFRMQI